MSKGLKALNELYETMPFVFEESRTKKHCLETIEKELKEGEKNKQALEILKDICNLKVYKNKSGQCFIEGTNILFLISQETYGLLRKVLL